MLLKKMQLANKTILITGGAGFIGSHLVDRLIDNNEIIVIDNLISSTSKNLNSHIDKPNFTFIKEDVADIEKFKNKIKNTDIIFHYAANYSVIKSTEKPLYDLHNNLDTTISLLEIMRNLDIEKITFASSSVVYGKAKTMPTSETCEIAPISNYGASKAASEAYLSAYSELYGLSALSLRYVNIFGPRSLHGVMYDFYHKLKKDATQLEILGDGTQSKSYLYIDDCIDATMLAVENNNKKYDTINIGSDERIDVKKIADYVHQEMNLPSVKYIFTGGRRGWNGDVPLMLLDISKLKKTGWSPKINFEVGVKKYINWLSNNEHS